MRGQRAAGVLGDVAQCREPDRAAGAQRRCQGDPALAAPLGAGGSIRLSALGDISQDASAALTAHGGAGALSVTSDAGSVRLDLAGNAVGSLTGRAAGGFAFLGAAPLTVGAVSAGASIALSTIGAPMTIQGPLEAAAGIAVASGGSLNLPGTVIRTHGGDVQLRAAGNLAADNARITAPGTLTLAADAAGATLRLVGGTYDAQYVVLTAGPAGDGAAIASYSGVTFRVGTALLVAAGGGVGREGDLASTVLPWQAEAVPLTLFDTRRSATALRALNPSAFTPATRDNPLLEAGEQVWQVSNGRRSLPGGARIIGQADGSGAATAAAAGAVVIDLDAGHSPVFFLIDGGTATGTVFAGRVGVHGLPGALRLPGDMVVDLTGELAGISGNAAARFGRVATNDPAEQGRYRFDNCVLDTINCVVPSLAQPVVLPVSNRIDIRTDTLRLDPDVLLPNTAEEDY